MKVETVGDAIMVAKKDSTIDKIRKHLMGERHYEDLSPLVLEIKKRIEFAYHQYMDGKTDIQIRNMLESQFGISFVQAYSDIRNMMEIFGDVNDSNMKLKRYWAEQRAKESYNKCMAKGDLKCAQGFLKLFIEITGVKNTDIEEERLKMMQQNIININLGDSSMEFIKKMNNGGSVDFTSMVSEEVMQEIENAILEEDGPAND